MHSGSRCLLVSELESCSSIIQITLCFEFPYPRHPHQQPPKLVQFSQVTNGTSPNNDLLKALFFINEQWLIPIIAAGKKVNLVIISHPPWYHPVFLFRTIPQEADKTQLKIRANLFCTFAIHNFMEHHHHHRQP